MLKYIILIFIIASSSLSAEKQWVQKKYAEEESFKSMVYLDSLNFYAFTDSVRVHKVFRSIDKGQTWKMLYRKVRSLITDSVSTVNHCWVTDSSTMYVVYSSSIIFDKSTDGGETFNRVTFGELSIPLKRNKIYDFKMYDKNFGVLCCDYQIIYTRDAWETYKVIKLEEDYERIGEPFFIVDSNNVAFLKRRSYSHNFVLLNLSTETWSTYSEEEKLEESTPQKVMFAITFVNDTLGFACGGQKNGQGGARYDIIWKTTDKGKNWKVVHHDNGPIMGFGLVSISFADELNGIAVASWGIVLETTNGGENWSYIDAPEEAEYSLGNRIIYAGEYPVLTTHSGYLFRQEIVDEVEEYEDDNINIYQFFDKLKIEFTNKSINETQIQIVDLLGREILKKSFENQQNISIDLSQIYSGFYMYRIISDGRVLRTGKIIR
jgi:Secretion system C-terminal sorting domain